MSRFKPSEELSPIKREAPRDWWIAYIQFNGKPGRCGPYTQYEAEHRMLSTHWRPGSAPQYERDGDGKRHWPGDKSKNRETRADKRLSAKERIHRAAYLAERVANEGQ